MDRTRLREFIFKAVFQFEFTDEDERDERFARFMELNLDDEKNGRAKEYIEKKVEAVRLKLHDIDAIISSHTKGWRIERLNKVDLAILRLGVFEVLYDEEIPVSVAISEAVLLAKSYSTLKSASFINGILGQIEKEASA